MANLKSLVDPKFNEDDVTILLVKRIAGSADSGVSAEASLSPESWISER